MSFGRPYIMNIEACIHDGWLTLIDINPDVNKDYLYYIISSSVVKEQFENFAIGSTVKNLNIEIVNKVKIPLPSIHIQEEIVAEMEVKENFIKQTKEIIAKQKQRRDLIISKLWEA